MKPRRSRVLIAVAAAWLSLHGCGRGHPPADTPADTTAAARLGAPPAPDTLVHGSRYGAATIRNRRTLDSLAKALGPERFLIALKVNRRDSLHVRDGDSLMVPVDSAATLLDLAPFPPEAPAVRDSAKLLLVSRRVQAFAAYERGRLVRWGPTSTGRESLPTPEGLYHTNWKDRVRTSTFNDEWLLRWYVNLENYLGISFHLYDLPGYPASHSCIRLLEDDARWIYDWCDTWTLDPANRSRVLVEGTPVVVFGRFAHGTKAPWRRLAVDSSATDVPWFEIAAALRHVGRFAVSDSLKRATLAALAAKRDSAAAMPR